MSEWSVVPQVVQVPFMVLPVYVCLAGPASLKVFRPHFEFDRPAGVSESFSVSEHHDLSVDAAARDFQNADRSESRGKVMREDWAARVNQKGFLAELEAFHVGIAADEDIDALAVQAGAQDLLNWPGLRSKLVCHTDAPAFDVEELHLRHPRVIKQVVVSFGNQQGRKLPAPIQNGRRGNIARMQDEVYATQRVGGLGAQLIENTDKRRKMGIGD